LAKKSLLEKAYEAREKVFQAEQRKFHFDTLHHTHEEIGDIICRQEIEQVPDDALNAAVLALLAARSSLAHCLAHTQIKTPRPKARRKG
jgi:hypothetical protein